MTSRKRSKNEGDGGTGVYMREWTTSRVTAADRPYGELYDFYRVSPENFGYHLVKPNVCVISGLRREADESWAFPSIYAANSGNMLRRFGTKYRSHLQGSRIQNDLDSLPSWPLNVEPETSVRNYHYSPLNSPEERSAEKPNLITL